MYAEAAGRDADKIKCVLQEGCVYSFGKFLVVNMKSSYKPFCAKYMIRLTPWTKMDRAEPPIRSFPRFVFHLAPLSDIKSRVGVEELVDHVPQTELLVLDPNSRSAQQ
jgi:replication factor A1